MQTINEKMAKNVKRLTSILPKEKERVENPHEKSREENENKRLIKNTKKLV